MKVQLLEKGLADAVFEPGDGREIRGEEMNRLCYTLADMEELLALERRRSQPARTPLPRMRRPANCQ